MRNRRSFARRGSRRSANRKHDAQQAIIRPARESGQRKPEARCATGDHSPGAGVGATQTGSTMRNRQSFARRGSRGSANRKHDAQQAIIRPAREAAQRKPEARCATGDHSPGAGVGATQTGSTMRNRRSFARRGSRGSANRKHDAQQAIIRPARESGQLRYAGGGALSAKRAPSVGANRIRHRPKQRVT